MPDCRRTENGICVHDLIREGDGKSMVTTLSSKDKMWTKAYGEPAKRKDIFKKDTVKEEPIAGKVVHYTRF